MVFQGAILHFHVSSRECKFGEARQRGKDDVNQVRPIWPKASWGCQVVFSPLIGGLRAAFEDCEAPNPHGHIALQESTPPSHSKKTILQPKSDGLQPTSGGLQPKSGGLQPASDGLQPNSDGLQPKSDGLQPTGDGLQPKRDGLQPKSDGLQP